MISFAGLAPDVAQAMCTPMHLILPASASASSPSTPSTSTSSPPTPATGALYLGAVTAVLDPSLLAEHHIQHLVQVLDVPWLPAPPPGLTAYRMDILDLESVDLRPHLDGAVADIDAALRAGRNVLVHCQQGVSRSPAVVIAYLIRKRGMGYEAAAALVRQRRPCVKPNAGFVRCLKEWGAATQATAQAQAQATAQAQAAGYAPPVRGAARPTARTREVLSH
ncbi:DSPc-domain-containing protein [Dentipellis sp. KUC8613]|nr:DSPc-domain-containing protein [Dentipellis sp. KUC8613]